MSIPSEGARAFIALNRFGLGARLDEEAPADPKGWLLGQFETYEPEPPAMKDLARSSVISTTYRENVVKLRAMSEAKRRKARKALYRRGRNHYRREIDARTMTSVTSRTPFVERLVHFWANHFALSADTPFMEALTGSFEREAIRPHVLGRFEDMLLAVEKHPAMLTYLDQTRSVGPNSARARRAAEKDEPRKPGINENLAREILELHTLGVRTGYSQKDVTEFALAMSGWTVAQPGASGGAEVGAFLFKPPFHEPGPRTILGKTYDEDGMDQAEAVLHDVARSEATAAHIAIKLARHFVADTPPESLVNKLRAAFLDSGGDLPTVYRALIDAPEAWDLRPRKFKTPWEWNISALRAIGYGSPPLSMAETAKQLGQPVWRPQSPAGYDDIADSWAAPDALVRRVEVAQRLARKTAPRVDAREIARTLVGPTLSETTLKEIARAESPATAIALLLVSPEFQRR